MGKENNRDYQENSPRDCKEKSPKGAAGKATAGTAPEGKMQMPAGVVPVVVVPDGQGGYLRKDNGQPVAVARARSPVAVRAGDPAVPPPWASLPTRAEPAHFGDSGALGAGHSPRDSPKKMSAIVSPRETVRPGVRGGTQERAPSPARKCDSSVWAFLYHRKELELAEEDSTKASSEYGETGLLESAMSWAAFSDAELRDYAQVALSAEVAPSLLERLSRRDIIGMLATLRMSPKRSSSRPSSPARSQTMSRSLSRPQTPRAASPPVSPRSRASLPGLPRSPGGRSTSRSLSPRRDNFSTMSASTSTYLFSGQTTACGVPLPRERYCAVEGHKMGRRGRGLGSPTRSSFSNELGVLQTMEVQKLQESSINELHVACGCTH